MRDVYTLNSNYYDLRKEDFIYEDFTSNRVN